MVSLRLEPTDGQTIAAALPGQFIVLQLGPGSAPAMMRSYSLSGEPGSSYYRVSVKREAHGAASAYVDDELKVGDVVQASAARGSFTLRPGDTPVVLLSAGIGVTPVLAMLHALAAGAIDKANLAATRKPERLRTSVCRGNADCLEPLAHHHSYICVQLAPIPRIGPTLISTLPATPSMRVLQELELPRNADFYICGPSAFMSDLTGGLAAWGVAPGRIHTEMFGAGPSITPGIAASPRRQPHLPTGSVGSGPMVSFARSGLDVRWGPSFQSLLELAEACDVPVRWACRTGVCHSCESGLVAG